MPMNYREGVCVCVCVCVWDQWPHLVLQFINVIIDINDLSIQHVGPTPAVVQRTVVVLNGALESWENEFILNSTAVLQLIAWASVAKKCVCVCVCVFTHSDVLHRLVEIVQLSPGHGAGVEAAQLTGHWAEVVVHLVQILQQDDDTAVTRCKKNKKKNQQTNTRHTHILNFSQVSCRTSFLFVLSGIFCLLSTFKFI